MSTMLQMDFLMMLGMRLRGKVSFFNNFENVVSNSLLGVVKRCRLMGRILQ